MATLFGLGGIAAAAPGGSHALHLSVSPASPSSNPSPTFTVTGPGAGSAHCAITGPGGYSAAFSACTSVTPRPSFAAAGAYTFSITSGGSGSISYDYLGSPGGGGNPGTPPAPPVVSVASPGSSATPTFTFTDTSAGVFACRLTTPSGTVSSPTFCTSPDQVTLSAGDGSYTLTVTIYNFYGSASTAAVYQLVTAPPSISVAPASPSTSTTPTFTLTDSEPGVTFACALSPPVGSATVGPCPASYSPTLSAGPGTYTLSATATDPQGNTSQASIPVTYVLLAAGSPPAPQVVAPASPANSATPAFTFSDSQGGVSYTCILSGPAGTGTPAPCTSPYPAQLAVDGTYTLSVTASASGLSSAPGTAVYVLDTVRPTLTLAESPTSPSTDTSPRFTAAAGDSLAVTLTCSLTGPGGFDRKPSGCADVSGLSLPVIGVYTFSVTAVDKAGNATSASEAYDLRAPPPPSNGRPPAQLPPSPPAFSHVATSPGTDPNPSWSFTLPLGAGGECSLLSGAAEVVPPATCSGTISYDLSPFGPGDYTVRVVAVDSSGQTSVAASSEYQLVSPAWSAVTPPPTLPPSTGPLTGTTAGSGTSLPPAPGHTGASAATPPPNSAPAARRLVVPLLNPPVGTAAAPTGRSEAGSLAPRPTPSPTTAPLAIAPVLSVLPPQVRKVVSGVVTAVVQTHDHGTFPLALIAIVVAFLAVQNRIDRRDPKLALAPRSADEDLEFAESYGGIE